jgi:cytochrome b involved in lipid metabolism
VVGQKMAQEPQVKKSRKNDSEPHYVILYKKNVDVSKWSRHHPGGTKVLRIFENRDATMQFEAAHSQAAKNKLKLFLKDSKDIEEKEWHGMVPEKSKQEVCVLRSSSIVLVKRKRKKS